MSNRTLAERIVAAVKSGGEAEFDHKGKRYKFDPFGLVDFLKDMGFQVIDEVVDEVKELVEEDKPKKRVKKVKHEEVEDLEEV